MTPDQIAAMIPEEVVEAGARAYFRLEDGFDGLLPSSRSAIKGNIRAAIAAGLAKWPGGVQNFSWDGSRSRIILPLTTKESDHDR